MPKGMVVQHIAYSDHCASLSKSPADNVRTFGPRSSHVRLQSHATDSDPYSFTVLEHRYRCLLVGSSGVLGVRHHIGQPGRHGKERRRSPYGVTAERLVGEVSTHCYQTMTLSLYIYL